MMKPTLTYEEWATSRFKACEEAAKKNDIQAASDAACRAGAQWLRDFVPNGQKIGTQLRVRLPKASDLLLPLLDQQEVIHHRPGIRRLDDKEMGDMLMAALRENNQLRQQVAMLQTENEALRLPGTVRVVTIPANPVLPSESDRIWEAVKLAAMGA